MGCGCRCFPRARLMSDISKNFVWRSLYHPQLEHCFASLPRQRILVLDNELLRREPGPTLTRVLRFLGLPETDLSRHSEADIQAEFKRRYPDFEAITGWAAHGSDHHEIPPDVRVALEDFFRPYNRRLFDLLGVEPFDHWKV
jgi:hypothetical protein